MVESDERPARASAIDRLAFETLISDTSARLMCGPDVSSGIEQSLDEVRRFFRADRCGFMAVLGAGAAVHVRHASYGPGVAPVPAAVNLAEHFPWSVVQLIERRLPVVMSRLDDLPAEAASDRRALEAMGTRAQLTVPVVTGRDVTHLIVIHAIDEAREWPIAYVPRLRLLGEMLATAVQRQEALVAIRDREERMARAAAAGGCGLWDFDATARRFWVTSETRRLYGLGPEDDTTYDRFLGLLHAEDRDAVAAAVDESVAQGTSFEREYRIHVGAEIRWIRAVGRPDGAGRLLGASVDVTARVVANQRAQNHASRVAAAADAAGIAFADSSEDGTDVTVDQGFGALLGLGPEDLCRMPEAWLARIDPAQRDEVLAKARDLEAGVVEHAAVEYRYAHPTRGALWLRHATRRMAPDHGAARLINAVQDITAPRSREEALTAAHDEVKRLRDQLQHENVYLRRELARGSGDLVTGRSAAIRSTLHLAEQVAATNATVLLIGETGTGKEKFASYIHQASPRRNQGMVRVNCSAIPAALIESELFGREKGAYTNALSRQIGRFELAQRSTLFLDEIGELPLDVQVKLLRMLQERTIERLGSSTTISVDVRIIAATNRDLEAAVRDGTFRNDLYYRLNVFPIVIPPLRQRRDDIPVLVEALVEELGSAMGKRVDAIAADSMRALTAYDWPGNVRELRNVLERAMILATGRTLHVEPPERRAAVPPTAPSPAPNADLCYVEREHILRVLADTGWRIRGARGAAEVLGLKPTTLEARMARLDIRRPGHTVVGEAPPGWSDPSYAGPRRPS